jgi:transcriptional regulator with XRE-family HTH domain
MENKMFDVGKRIKDIREEKNISLTELARKAGIAQSSLSYIESGHNKPTVYTIEKICQALGTSLVGFFDVQYSDIHIPPDISDFSSQKNNQDIIRLIMAIKTSGYSDDIIKEWLTSLFKTLESHRVYYVNPEIKGKMDELEKHLRHGIKKSTFQT